MRLKKTVIVIAPPTILRFLPRDRLAESGYFLTGVKSLPEAVKLTETIVAHQILVDARVRDGTASIVAGLKAFPRTRNVGIRIGCDCTCWRQLEVALQGEEG
jgi:hypothetical protein